MRTPQEINSPALNRLLQQLDDTPGFCGVEGSAQAIAKLVDHDGSSGELADAILCDPALTAKVLQLANYTDRTISGRNVSTIDQALSILGPGKIKTIAAALQPIESLPGEAQKSQLRAEVAVALFSGLLAASVARIGGTQYSTHEAQVCGLLQNLGRMMALFYLYEEIENCQKLQAEQNITEQTAVMEVLGVDFVGMGSAIAYYWGLSVIVQKSLAHDELTAPPQSAANATAWYTLCSLFCRRMAAILFRLPENEEAGRIARCIEFFQKVLHLGEKEGLALVEKCLLDTDATLVALGFPSGVAQARALLRKSTEKTQDILLDYDPLVKQADAEGAEAPIEAIKRIMRQIHNHCGFDCTLVCLPAGSGLIAVAGIGRSAGQLTPRFRSSGLKRDVFRKAMNEGRDLFVPDVDGLEYASLIPEWYRELVGAKSMVLLPLVSEEQFIGMIYGDYSFARPEAPVELAGSDLQEWRNELLHAIRPDAGMPVTEEIAEPVLRLAHEGRKYVVDAQHPLLRIGRAEKADVLLRNSRASRMHATIELRDGGFVFCDRSSNGSYITIRGNEEVHLCGGEFTLWGRGSICFGHPHRSSADERLEFCCED